MIDKFSTLVQDSQARLRPPIDAMIANTLIKCTNDALTPVTVKAIEYSLRQLSRNANLEDPESVKAYVAKATTNKNKQPVTPETKNRWLFAYDKFCKYNDIQWTKPYYKSEEKSPLIPTTENVNAIINNASKKYAPIFTLLAEIGCSPQELANVTLSDIDTEKREIRITGTKGHGSGTYKLKQQTADMLLNYLAKNHDPKPFPNSRAIRQIWVDTRKRASDKLSKPELLKVQCRNLRNYSGERFYKSLPIRDPIAVMRHLRHKKLETTMHYIRAIVIDFDEDEQYITRTAKTPEEAMKLIDSGFAKADEFDGIHIYRKRK